MNGSVSVRNNKWLTKGIVTLTGVAAAVALPQLFHAIGAVSGTGAAVGAALLPMHIPVILAGLISGPVVGALVGAASPLVSFLISGMPTALLLPFLIIELAVYGLTAGLLAKTKLNSLVKLLIVQVTGRAARAAATLISVYFLGNNSMTAADAITFVSAGLFGILIQWALIPALLQYAERLRKRHE